LLTQHATTHKSATRITKRLALLTMLVMKWIIICAVYTLCQGLLRRFSKYPLVLFSNLFNFM